MKNKVDSWDQKVLLKKQEETEGACRTANFTISDFGNSIFSDDLGAKTSSNEQFGCLLKEILGFLVGLLVKII